MLGSGLFAAVALPSLAIFDELNSSSLIYLEKVHLLLAGAVLPLKGIWLVHSVWLLGLRRWRSNRKPDWLGVAAGYAGFVLLTAGWAFSHWRVSEFEEQAWSEYLAVSAALYLPFVYSLTFRGVSFKVSAAVSSKEQAVLS